MVTDDGFSADFDMGGGIQNSDALRDGILEASN